MLKKNANISNINIVISDYVEIKFNINRQSKYFLKKIQDNKYKQDLSFFSDIFLYDLSKDKKIKVKNFYPTMISNTFSEAFSLIGGRCEEIIINDIDFEKDERVNVWEITENVNFTQPKVHNFKNIKIENLYLKSLEAQDPSRKQVHEEICNEKCTIFHENEGYFTCEKRKIEWVNKFNEFKDLNNKKINQFKNGTGYFYYNDLFKNVNIKWDAILDDLFVLISWYSSDIINHRIKIIENKNKDLKIVFKNKYLGEGKQTVFPDVFYNLHDLIDNSYSALCNLKIKKLILGY